MLGEAAELLELGFGEVGQQLPVPQQELGAQGPVIVPDDTSASASSSRSTAPASCASATVSGGTSCATLPSGPPARMRTPRRRAAGPPAPAAPGGRGATPPTRTRPRPAAAAPHRA